MKPHIEKAHAIWKNHVHPSDTVIDATCGNGWDTLVLATLTPQGRVFAIDIQPAALETTKKRLKHFNHITYIEGCHCDLPEIHPSLVVYNLGYLPGGDKNVVTKTTTTLKSIEKACQLLKAGGLISIMLYPGHPEGALEAEAILKTFSTLPYELIEPNERQDAPKLLLLRP